MHTSYASARTPRAAFRFTLVPLVIFVLGSCMPSISLTLSVEEELVGGIRVVRVPHDAPQGMNVDLRDGTTFFVPPGHLPPHGACRIWYPGRPPGQQPPPGDCGDLATRVPPEAVLLRR